MRPPISWVCLSGTSMFQEVEQTTPLRKGSMCVCVYKVCPMGRPELTTNGVAKKVVKRGLSKEVPLPTTPRLTVLLATPPAIGSIKRGHQGGRPKRVRMGVDKLPDDQSVPERVESTCLRHVSTCTYRPASPNGPNLVVAGSTLDGVGQMSAQIEQMRANLRRFRANVGAFWVNLGRPWSNSDQSWLDSGPCVVGFGIICVEVGRNRAKVGRIRIGRIRSKLMGCLGDPPSGRTPHSHRRGGRPWERRAWGPKAAGRPTK